jgi:hypothetical protein
MWKLYSRPTIVQQLWFCYRKRPLSVTYWAKFLKALASLNVEELWLLHSVPFCMWYHTLFPSIVMHSGSQTLVLWPVSWLFQIWGVPLYNKNCLSLKCTYFTHMLFVIVRTLFIYCRYKLSAAELLIAWNHCILLNIHHIEQCFN